MRRCNLCNGRIWPWSKTDTDETPNDSHARCVKTSQLIDDTFKKMQNAGEIPTPEEYKAIMNRRKKHGRRKA
jgi:hypothetical protein